MKECKDAEIVGVVKSDIDEKTIYLSWNEYEQFLNDITDAFKGADVSGVYPINVSALTMAQCIANRLGVKMISEPEARCLAVKPIADGSSMLYGNLTIATWVRIAGDKWAPDYSMLTVEPGIKIKFPWE